MSRWALYTDLYQLTMAQGYFLTGKYLDDASFYMYFRSYPFEGGYALSCGQAQLAEIFEDFAFDEDDIAYLASLKSADGNVLFCRKFLDYLAGMRLSCDIDAVLEGTVVFPHEPILTVTGSILQCQLLETLILNCMNFETLIATKASRVVHAAGQSPVSEFGLRRAQGLGGIWGSRAAYIGGCASTSNVEAARQFGIPPSGTHAHSWVMSYPSELEAFRAYASMYPSGCILLVDTYDVEEGVKNAIIVGQEMKARGQTLFGIRIDSGDLSWLAKRARKMLDDAGLRDTGIILSNDLDEKTIRSILAEDTPVDGWGVGTKLAVAYDQPTLGGVYKMSASRRRDSEDWEDTLKVSESISKITTPGVLNVRRYRYDDGKLAGDMVYDVNRGVEDGEIIVDPLDSLRRKELRGKRWETILVPLVQKGKVVIPPDARTAQIARERAAMSLGSLDETQLRLLNPHTYPVGLEESLHQRRQDLIASLRGVH